MKEILLTSSVLILALLVLREVFREKISRRVQYALWGLVLLRLLVPVNLPAVDFSVLSAVEPARAQVEQRLEENPVYVLPVERREVSSFSEKLPEPTVILPVEGRYASITQEKGQPAVMTSYAFTLEEALGLAWIAGMIGMSVWMAVSNLRLWVMLRKKRIPLELDCRYPVFLVEDGLVSPCLFGVFKPAVYLTPGALEDDEGLKHVLAHEETHGRHWDPVWALLRSICLVAYWFDPLVWWAAAASKEDCELACDEGALARLGEDQRIPYGQTLLRLIPLKKNRGGVLLTATTMTSDKKRMKERIMRIAENKKMKTAALCALLALVVALCAVTFTGCTADAAAEPDLTDAAAEPDLPYVPSSDLPVEVVEPKNLADTLTVPLTDLQPYEPVRVETHSVETLFDGSHHDEHDGHHGQQQYRVGGGCHTTEGCATFAWSYDGNVYVSSQILAQSSFPGDYFLCIEEQAYNEETFTDVLGYDGVAISYLGEFEDDWTTTINDYYVFEEDGVYLLARVYGVPYLLDVNGDGINELVGTDGITQAQIFFQRNGELYEANISKLLNAYLERSDGDYWKYSYFCGWSENHPQYMELETKVPIATANGVETDFWWRRQVYFDGVNLYLYRPERKMNDHLLDGIQDLSAVTDAARELVKTRFEDWVENYGKGWNDPDHDPPEWDDYCITGIECTYMNDPGQLPGGFQLAVYEVDYEFHSPTPENVVRTGVIYVCDDGWAGGFHDEKHLVFQILDDGSYKLLENHMLYGASPSAGDFDGEIGVVMMQNQLVKPSELSGETLFLGAMGNPAAFADALALYPDNEQDIALLKLLEHLDYMDSNGYYKMEYFQQIVEAMDDYSGNGAGVFQRLENLMVNPISFPPF